MRANAKWAKSKWANAKWANAIRPYRRVGAMIKWANAIRPYIALLIFLLLFEGKVRAQVVTENKVFPVGEVFELEAYYNLGFIWTKIGVATFETSEDEHGNYLFTVKMMNLPKWDWLYEVHTLHRAACTKNMKPLYMRCDVHENGLDYTDEYVYTDKGGYNSIHRHRELRRDSTTNILDTTFSLPYEAKDIINAIYMARNYIPMIYKGVENPKDVPFYPIFGNTTHKIIGNFYDKETIKTRDGKTYQCRKYTAAVGEGTIVDKDPVYAYLTDDGHMIPVLVEAKLSIGYVKIYLKSYTKK